MLVEANLDRTQAYAQISWTNNNLHRQELEAQDILSLVLDMEECLWKDKYRIKWYLEGDQNTSFFQRVNKTRNSLKPIVHPEKLFD